MTWSKTSRIFSRMTQFICLSIHSWLKKTLLASENFQTVLLGVRYVALLQDLRGIWLVSPRKTNHLHTVYFGWLPTPHDKYNETIRLCLCHVNGINTWKYENGKKTCFQIVRVRGKGILWKIIVWTDIFHSFWDKGPWIPRPQILSRNIVFK